MGSEGCVLITGCSVSDHRNYEIKLFENPKGVQDNSDNYPIRLILSSYYWQANSYGRLFRDHDFSLCLLLSVLVLSFSFIRCS
jgi:hypothetical protein